MGIIRVYLFMKTRHATIEDRERWDQFVLDNSGSFTQSWAWGDFMATQKDQVWRLIAEDDHKIVGVMMLFGVNRGLGSLLYSPKGPIITNERLTTLGAIVTAMIKEVEKIAAATKGIIFQMDPETTDESWLPLYDELQFSKTERDIMPRHTLILDISHSEEDLLKTMHPKTRYNINLAHKKGIEIIVDNSKYKEFYELLKKTMKRQNINLFGPNYFEKILSVPFVKLYLAKYDGHYIAANIIVNWGNMATYLFGASDYDYRNIMAPHLLQWQAIKDAKREGLIFYDFWGAAPKDVSGREEKWIGFTKFKMGFSPDAEITEYLGTYEKIYQPLKLGIYQFIRKIF